jgi:hypothetical protein
MFTGVFTLLIFEASLRTGLIPVNSKYDALFQNSPLGIRIISGDKKTVLSSARASEYDDDTMKSAAASSPLPVQPDENTLLFATGIPGGNAFWREDITKLNQLRAEASESVRRLTAANAVLIQEEKIKRAVAEEAEKMKLMSKLDDEISGHISKLSDMIAHLGNGAGSPSDTVRAALLLCYVKRRCNLFFREQETETLSADELTYYTVVYTNELNDIAAHLGMKIILTGEIKTSLSVRKVTIFYDFYYSVVEWAAGHSCSGILAQLENKSGSVAVRLLLPEEARAFSLGAAVSAAITEAGGVYALRDLDDTVSLNLTFTEGGEGDA